LPGSRPGSLVSSAFQDSFTSVISALQSSS